MRVIFFILVLSIGFQVSAGETITWYGYSKTRTPDNPRAMDRLVTYFNTNVTPRLGFKLRYETNIEAIESAYEDGPGALQGVDVVEIKDAVNIGLPRLTMLFAPLQSEVLEENIPVGLRAHDNTWFAISKRARVIFYDPRVVRPEELSTYEDLGNPKWKDKLCLRVAGKTYNKALVSFFMETKGVGETRTMLESWTANSPIVTKVDMAGSNEKEMGVIQAIHEGHCAVGVANTYYLPAFKKRYPSTQVTAFFPNQGEEGYGTHINITSLGVVANSKKKKMAQQFVEWMSSVEAQEFYSQFTNKYPTNSQAKLTPTLKGFGVFKENSSFNFEVASDLSEDAYLMMVMAGWKNEPTPVRKYKNATK